MLYSSSTSLVQKQETVNELVRSFTEMGCNYSPKKQYIHCHLLEFIENQSNVHDEHGERMHQCMKLFEARYEEKRTRNLITNFIWTHYN